MSSYGITKRISHALRGGIGAVLLAIAALVGYVAIINHQPLDFQPSENPSPSVNGYPDFLRAGSMAQDMKHAFPSNDPFTSTFPDSLPNYSLAYEDARPILALIRTALRKPCMCPLVSSQVSNKTDLTKLRILASLIKDAADYQYIIGHPFESAQIRLDGMEMAAVASHGGALKNYLASHYIDTICRRGLEKTLSKLSANQLEAILQRLKDIESKEPGFPVIVKAEGKARTNTDYHEIEKQGDLGFWKEMYNITPLNRILHHPYPWLTYLIENKSELLRENQRYYQLIAKETSHSYHRQMINRAPDNLFMLDFPSKIWEECWGKYVYDQTYHELLLVETALYLYRIQIGRYPPSLKALVPKYIPSVPEDPFNNAPPSVPLKFPWRSYILENSLYHNQPFHYRLESNGRAFMLYSVGPDMVDNGGKSNKRDSSASGDMVVGKGL